MSIPTLSDCPRCGTKSLVGGLIDPDGYIDEPTCENGCVLSEEDLADIRLNTEYDYRQYVADHVFTRGR